ncbi:MAG: peptidylprolyl isomerase [Scytonema sp. PMC 1070.18]|nr:peptidylprolyl isomerase [Scytonema sp. PMC 1070.18]
MTELIQLGNRTIAASDLITLLASYQMLPQLQRELIIDEAIASIECTQEEVSQAQQQFYAEHQFTTEAEVRAWMAHYGIAPQQLGSIITRKLKIEKFKQATWGNKLEPYFFQCKGQLDKVIYSLLRTQDVGVAQELYFRIQAKEQSFSELAREYSQGPESQTGGLVGPIELSSLHPVMMHMLSSCQPGKVLPPTRIGDWLVIVRLEKFLPVQLDEHMKVRLLNELFENWVKQQLQKVRTTDEGESVGQLVGSG